MANVVWDLAERVEDALVSYLQQVVSDTMRIYGAWNFDTPQMPCAVVHVGGEGPVSEDATWHNARLLEAKVSVMVEAAPEMEDDTILRTARQVNRDVRSTVIAALAQTALPDKLNEQNIERLIISMAQLTETEREIDGRVFETICTIGIIATTT